MNPQLGLAPVAEPEILARFILESSRFRKDNQTVKPEAFMPHPYVELSVTRHLDTAEQELWKFGMDVATQRKKPLYGRADIIAASVRQNSLNIHPDPLAENPFLANIKGWPGEKSAQKMIALQLAAASTFTPFLEAPQ
jgi:hypothetical protein